MQGTVINLFVSSRLVGLVRKCFVYPLMAVGFVLSFIHHSSLLLPSQTVHTTYNA